MKLIKTIQQKYIADAKDVFTSYVDNDFRNWNTNKGDELAVCELTEDMTFEQMFKKPDEMVLTQQQIIDFCKNHKEFLRKGGRATFFLFKVGEKFFVASVLVNSDGLSVDVLRFEHGYVWDAGDVLRVVVPQLALKHLDIQPLELSNLVTLSGQKVTVTVGDKTYTATID